MRYTITGDNLRFVNVELQDGKEFHSVAKAMSYMTGNMRMESMLEGRFWKGIKRSVSGASMFLQKYTLQGGTGVIGLAILVIAVVIAAAWALSLPDVMDKVLYVAIVAIVAIVIVCIGAYVIFVVAAIPYHMAKGEQYRENVDYDLNDARPVEGKTSDDRKE